MVNQCENKAREYLKNEYPLAYIKKIPDFKQTGCMVGGLPDYLVIDNGNYYWYEIKYIPHKRKSININDFTEQQLIEFKKMSDADSSINVLIYFGKKRYSVKYLNLYKL